MPEEAKSEFWKDLKPITDSMKPDAQPEVYLPQVATDDDRYYAPLSDTVGSRPLWINVKDNSWADILFGFPSPMRQLLVDIRREVFAAQCASGEVSAPILLGRTSAAEGAQTSAL
ncbi:hypothetical protein ABT116_17950 [Streptomyces sp. NPDC002130]|uniref:hypothetical protein n=1 Tax=Streptomyces sp. NPDC002130 TaxID=3155568 RepID=UPI00332C2535